MPSSLADQHDAIMRLTRQHGATNVCLFGSTARGEEQEGSDLDLLLEMEPGRSLLDHVALKQDLEDLLGCEVDIVTEQSLHPRIRERVLQKAVRRLSPELLEKYPDVPWCRLAGFRDVLIHDYMGVDLDRGIAIRTERLVPYAAHERGSETQCPS